MIRLALAGASLIAALILAYVELFQAATYHHVGVWQFLVLDRVNKFALFAALWEYSPAMTLTYLGLAFASVGLFAWTVRDTARSGY